MHFPYQLCILDCSFDQMADRCLSRQILNQQMDLASMIRMKCGLNSIHVQLSRLQFPGLCDLCTIPTAPLPIAFRSHNPELQQQNNFTCIHAPATVADTLPGLASYDAIFLWRRFPAAVGAGPSTCLSHNLLGSSIRGLRGLRFARVFGPGAP